VTELRNFLVAATCAVACWLFMGFAVSSQIEAAIVFVPLSVSTVAAALFLLNLAFYGASSVRAAVAGRRSLPGWPAALARQPSPLCIGCEVAEAGSDIERLRQLTLIPMAGAGFCGDLYQRHRDCWVTTGDEKELARMLRHVTWRAS
jgi:hypothetical protein